MNSLNNSPQGTVSSPTMKTSLFKRLISTESSSSRDSYKLYYHSYEAYSFCGKEILLKLSQVIICLICSCLYSSISTSEKSQVRMIFPIIAYVSFLIISGIICLGYIFGVHMHDLLQRAFNMIGAIIFFTASCILFQNCFVTIVHQRNGDKVMSSDGKIIFAQATLSGINFILYLIDCVLSVKRSLKD
nr:uncharacterized protein LOC111419383 [Onthophagus taurus]